MGVDVAACRSPRFLPHPATLSTVTRDTGGKQGQGIRQAGPGMPTLHLVLCGLCKSYNLPGPLSPHVQNKADDTLEDGCYV